MYIYIYISIENIRFYRGVRLRSLLAYIPYLWRMGTWEPREATLASQGREGRRKEDRKRVRQSIRLLGSPVTIC